jgi:sulfane dehydrogenase subunit SoxC
MSWKKSGRRRFLKESTAVAVGALGAQSGLAAETESANEPHAGPRNYSNYGERSRFVTTARKDDYLSRLYPSKKVTPLQDLMGIITPAPLHFVANHSVPPDVDPREYRLLIHGMVDRPMTFTLDDLQRFPSESRIYFVECNGNGAPGKHSMSTARPEKTPSESVQDIHGRTSCSEWTGVPLSLVLNEAGVQKGASWIISEGYDSQRYSHSLPLSKAMDDVLLAYGQNGEPVRPEQGYPVRLLAPGFQGPESVKWLRQIKVVDEPYGTREEISMHSYLTPNLQGKARWFHFEMPPKSVILRPALGQQMPGKGYYEITGLAWSGGGAIRRVEVSVDGGRSWKDAKLQEPVLRLAHTRFRFNWSWNGEETVILSRCTDERGTVQPSLAEFSKRLGAPKDFWKTSSVFHFNAIQPWRIERDGRVTDAMEL